MPADRTFDQIMEAIQAADRDRALSLAVDACKGGDRQPLVLMLAAEWLEANGKPQDALRLLQEATTNERDEPELWRRLGQLLTRFGQLPDAVAAFEEALDLDPDNLAVLLPAGEASYRSGMLRKALGFFERADEIQAHQPDTIAAIAAVHAGLRDADRARAYAERALRIAPANQTAHVAMARAELLAGDTEQAAARAAGLAKLKDSNKVLALDLLAEALDALDRPAQAFEAYRLRNSLVEKSLRQTPEVRDRRVGQAHRIAAWLGSPAAEAPHDPVSNSSPAAGHAFIIGFPRSGTTLLEKSLAGHPHVLTLPEIDLLQTAGTAFLANELALERLSNASAQDLQPFVDLYWEGAKKALGTPLEGKVLIDKLPLHTLALPLIARMFPAARIMFAVRDPRDVVLSCFRRRFQLNSAMYEFLQLDRTARFYDAVMALGTKGMEALNLPVLEVRHEAIVRDFDGKMAKILAFIGLEMNPGVHDFAQQAKDNPRTPSDLQLLKGLNEDGFDQWRRYRPQLEPVLGILDPWVRHFDYPQ